MPCHTRQCRRSHLGTQLRQHNEGRLRLIFFGSITHRMIKENNATYGFLRLACIMPELRIADPDFNRDKIVAALENAAQQGVQFAVLPELCITGYTCQDLFFQKVLQDKAVETLFNLAEEIALLPLAAVVGLPLAISGKLFNCAAFIQGGHVRGLVPKTYLPNNNEFYEHRWFRSSWELPVESIQWEGNDIPIGADLLFDAENLLGCRIGIEICEDMWAVQPPSSAQALAGATILCNPSASNELLGKADYRRTLVAQQSSRCMGLYAYAGAGPWESTTDMVYSGHALIVENGVILAESRSFSFASEMITADVDLERLQHERQTNTAYGDAHLHCSFRVLPFHMPTQTNTNELQRPLARHPFVPADMQARAAHCGEIFSIQSTALARRIRHTGLSRLVLGVSGGLDSTLALLVCCHALDMLKMERDALICVTMPGFGTSSRTRNNATTLATLLGAQFREVPIGEAVNKHFSDIGHDPAVRDVTFENAQARERTQVLMDIANQVNGFVVGTGDLSEAALGWCTFNGDHMSMYHVNAGVPKTMVRYVIGWCAEELFQGETSRVLHDVIDTPISPELLPAGEETGAIQDTEATIGPYELHDFFLFYAQRHGFAPRKVFFLARKAFGDVYPPDVILQWLRLFYRRFFSQQFKRSAMPDGPKVGTVALSPRGDWRMPSDATATLWLRDLDDLACKSG